MGAVKDMMYCDECGQDKNDHMPFCKQFDAPYVNPKWEKGNTNIRPAHYTKYKIEPYTFFMENKLDMMTASVIKYTMRHADKNGVEDINKAIKCLEMMREFYYNE
jgi:hypothetical protein